MEGGSLAVVRRGDEWDEWGKLMEDEWVAYTSTPEADRPMWTAVRAMPTRLLPLIGQGRGRRVPRDAGIPEEAVN